MGHADVCLQVGSRSVMDMLDLCKNLEKVVTDAPINRQNFILKLQANNQISMTGIKALVKYGEENRISTPYFSLPCKDGANQMTTYKQVTIPEQQSYNVTKLMKIVGKINCTHLSYFFSAEEPTVRASSPEPHCELEEDFCETSPEIFLSSLNTNIVDIADVCDENIVRSNLREKCIKT